MIALTPFRELGFARHIPQSFEAYELQELAISMGTIISGTLAVQYS